MIQPFRAVSLALFALLLATGSAFAEEGATLPAPQCLDRKGEVLPEARDAVRITPDIEFPVAISQPATSAARWKKGCPLTDPIKVQAIITTEGKVCGASLLRPLPEACKALGEHAVDTIRHWKFRPAKSQGTPVAVIYDASINF
jgi:hypothetical protein